MENNSLRHHGILGMKWGVRRYQNKDGTLTAAGKKRYDKEMKDAKAERRALKNVQKNMQLTQAKLKKLEEIKTENERLKKNIKTGEEEEKPVNLEEKKKQVLESKSAKEVYKHKDLLSDKELQEAYVRLNYERNIKNLIPEEVNRGQQFLNKYVDMGKTIKDIVDTTDTLYKSYEKAKGLYETLFKAVDASSKKKK